MKAQNYKDIRKAILLFAMYLVLSVIMATCSFFFFMRTSSVEVSKVLEKTKDYDQIQSIQLDLTEKMDSLYYYISFLTFDSQINYKLMQNALSEKKIQFSNLLSELPARDCLLYRRLAGQLNIFFDTKDSLVVTTSELNAVREDLMRCVDANRKVTRKISIGGGLIFEK